MAVVLGSMKLLLGGTDPLGFKSLEAVSSMWSDTLPCYRRVSLASSMFHHLLCAAVMWGFSTSSCPCKESFP